MVACGKESQEGTFPAIWPVNPLWCKCVFQLYNSLCWPCLLTPVPYEGTSGGLQGERVCFFGGGGLVVYLCVYVCVSVCICVCLCMGEFVCVFMCALSGKKEERKPGRASGGHGWSIQNEEQVVFYAISQCITK